MSTGSHSGGQSRVVLNSQVLLFGRDAAGGRLGGELAERGWRRVALFSSGSARRIGLQERFIAQALGGVEVVPIEHPIAPHAPIADTEAIAATLHDEPLDALVALGGGSVSDTAKAVAILLAEGGELADHCSEFEYPDKLVHKVLREPKLPVVAVVTTLSGAEQTPGGGATTDAGVKRTFWDPQLACTISSYDTAVLAAVPSEILVTTAMNAMAHCAEGLYSRTSNPVSTAMALHGATTLSRGLLALACNGASDAAIDDLAAGAALSGLVIGNARVGLHHAICHVLGASLGLPHGVANSIMLPHVLEYNLSDTRAAQEALAQALRTGGVGSGAALRATAADLVDDVRLATGAPRRLRDFGVTENDLAAVARDTMQDRGLYFNPRRVAGPDALRALLGRAW